MMFGDVLAFIAGIVIVSLVSRVSRTTELRADRIEFDEAARQFVTDSLAHNGQLDIIANKKQAGDDAEYLAKEREQRGMNPVPGAAHRLPARDQRRARAPRARRAARGARADRGGTPRRLRSQRPALLWGQRGLKGSCDGMPRNH